MELENKSVLITGASHGLGRALAFTLAARGARVALLAREERALYEVAAQIRERGGHALPIVADVADKYAVHPVLGRAQAEHGPIDVLIHNASALLPVPLALLSDTECEDFERVLQVNVLGPFRFTKAVAAAMALRGHGEIVFVSSDAAVEAYPRWGAYGVSKAALDHSMRHWAVELNDTGVRAYSIDPGEMDTRMHEAAVPDADKSRLSKPELVARKIVASLGSVPSGARVRAEELEAAL